ncbi:hypothetical protein K440DRAFT_214520 [Wilcoxina mikolae CBS 423.85]|nr:hypothetical protein K440DRAFT_214520 [Wilcoxina mikolae CBS 423.85]
MSSKPTFNNAFAEAAYKKALKKGIDPHGAMPDDYSEKTDKYINFKGDRDFAIWNAAQGADSVGNRKLNRREATTPFLRYVPYPFSQTRNVRIQRIKEQHIWEHGL